MLAIIIVLIVNGLLIVAEAENSFHEFTEAHELSNSTNHHHNFSASAFHMSYLEKDDSQSNFSKGAHLKDSVEINSTDLQNRSIETSSTLLKDSDYSSQKDWTLSPISMNKNSDFENSNHTGVKPNISSGYIYLSNTEYMNKFPTVSGAEISNKSFNASSIIMTPVLFSAAKLDTSNMSEITVLGGDIQSTNSPKIIADHSNKYNLEIGSDYNATNINNFTSSIESFGVNLFAQKKSNAIKADNFMERTKVVTPVTYNVTSHRTKILDGNLTNKAQSNDQILSLSENKNDFALGISTVLPKPESNDFFQENITESYTTKESDEENGNSYQNINHETKTDGHEVDKSFSTEIVSAAEVNKSYTKYILEKASISDTAVQNVTKNIPNYFEEDNDKTVVHASSDPNTESFTLTSTDDLEFENEYFLGTESIIRNQLSTTEPRTEVKMNHKKMRNTEILIENSSETLLNYTQRSNVKLENWTDDLFSPYNEENTHPLTASMDGYKDFEVQEPTIEDKYFADENLENSSATQSTTESIPSYFEADTNETGVYKISDNTSESFTSISTDNFEFGNDYPLGNAEEKESLGIFQFLATEQETEGKSKIMNSETFTSTENSSEMRDYTERFNVKSENEAADSLLPGSDENPGELTSSTDDYKVLGVHDSNTEEKSLSDIKFPNSNILSSTENYERQPSYLEDFETTLIHTGTTAMVPLKYHIVTVRNIVELPDTNTESDMFISDQDFEAITELPNETEISKGDSTTLMTMQGGDDLNSEKSYSTFFSDNSSGFKYLNGEDNLEQEISVKTTYEAETTAKSALDLTEFSLENPAQNKELSNNFANAHLLSFDGLTATETESFKTATEGILQVEHATPITLISEKYNSSANIDINLHDYQIDGHKQNLEQVSTAETYENVNRKSFGNSTFLPTLNKTVLHDQEFIHETRTNESGVRNQSKNIESVSLLNSFMMGNKDIKPNVAPTRKKPPDINSTPAELDENNYTEVASTELNCYDKLQETTRATFTDKEFLITNIDNELKFTETEDTDYLEKSTMRSFLTDGETIGSFDDINTNQDTMYQIQNEVPQPTTENIPSVFNVFLENTKDKSATTSGILSELNQTKPSFEKIEIHEESDVLEKIPTTTHLDVIDYTASERVSYESFVNKENLSIVTPHFDAAVDTPVVTETERELAMTFSAPDDPQETTEDLVTSDRHFESKEHKYVSSAFMNSDENDSMRKTTDFYNFDTKFVERGEVSSDYVTFGETTPVLETINNMTLNLSETSEMSNMRNIENVETENSSQIGITELSKTNFSEKLQNSTLMVPVFHLLVNETTLLNNALQAITTPITNLHDDENTAVTDSQLSLKAPTPLTVTYHAENLAFEQSVISTINFVDSTTKAFNGSEEVTSTPSLIPKDTLDTDTTTNLKIFDDTTTSSKSETFENENIGFEVTITEENISKSSEDDEMNHQIEFLNLRDGEQFTTTANIVESTADSSSRSTADSKENSLVSQTDNDSFYKFYTERTWNEKEDFVDTTFVSSLSEETRIPAEKNISSILVQNLDANLTGHESTLNTKIRTSGSRFNTPIQSENDSSLLQEMELPLLTTKQLGYSAFSEEAVNNKNNKSGHNEETTSHNFSLSDATSIADASTTIKEELFLDNFPTKEKSEETTFNEQFWNEYRSFVSKNSSLNTEKVPQNEENYTYDFEISTKPSNYETFYETPFPNDEQPFFIKETTVSASNKTSDEILHDTARISKMRSEKKSLLNKEISKLSKENDTYAFEISKKLSSYEPFHQTSFSNDELPFFLEETTVSADKTSYETLHDVSKSSEEESLLDTEMSVQSEENNNTHAFEISTKFSNYEHFHETRFPSDEQQLFEEETTFSAENNTMSHLTEKTSHESLHDMAIFSTMSIHEASSLDAEMNVQSKKNDSFAFESPTKSSYYETFPETSFPNDEQPLFAAETTLNADKTMMHLIDKTSYEIKHNITTISTISSEAESSLDTKMRTQNVENDTYTFETSTKSSNYETFPNDEQTLFAEETTVSTDGKTAPHQADKTSHKSIQDMVIVPTEGLNEKNMSKHVEIFKNSPIIKHISYKVSDDTTFAPTTNEMNIRRVTLNDGMGATSNVFTNPVHFQDEVNVDLEDLTVFLESKNNESLLKAATEPTLINDQEWNFMTQVNETEFILEDQIGTTTTFKQDIFSDNVLTGRKDTAMNETIGNITIEGTSVTVMAIHQDNMDTALVTLEDVAGENISMYPINDETTLDSVTLIHTSDQTDYSDAKDTKTTYSAFFSQIPKTSEPNKTYADSNMPETTINAQFSTRESFGEKLILDTKSNADMNALLMNTETNAYKYTATTEAFLSVRENQTSSPADSSYTVLDEDDAFTIRTVTKINEHQISLNTSDTFLITTPESDQTFFETYASNEDHVISDYNFSNETLETSVKPLELNIQTDQAETLIVNTDFNTQKDFTILEQGLTEKYPNDTEITYKHSEEMHFSEAATIDSQPLEEISNVSVIQGDTSLLTSVLEDQEPIFFDRPAPEYQENVQEDIEFTYGREHPPTIEVLDDDEVNFTKQGKESEDNVKLTTASVFDKYEISLESTENSNFYTTYEQDTVQPQDLYGEIHITTNTSILESSVESKVMIPSISIERNSLKENKTSSTNNETDYISTTESEYDPKNERSSSPLGIISVSNTFLNTRESIEVASAMNEDWLNIHNMNNETISQESLQTTATEKNANVLLKNIANTELNTYENISGTSEIETTLSLQTIYPAAKVKIENEDESFSVTLQDAVTMLDATYHGSEGIPTSFDLFEKDQRSSSETPMSDLWNLKSETTEEIAEPLTTTPDAGSENYSELEETSSDSTFKGIFPELPLTSTITNDILNVHTYGDEVSSETQDFVSLKNVTEIYKNITSAHFDATVLNTFENISDMSGINIIKGTGTTVSVTKPIITKEEDEYFPTAATKITDYHEMGEIETSSFDSLSEETVLEISGTDLLDSISKLKDQSMEVPTPYSEFSYKETFPGTSLSSRTNEDFFNTYNTGVETSAETNESSELNATEMYTSARLKHNDYSTELPISSYEIISDSKGIIPMTVLQTTSPVTESVSEDFSKTTTLDHEFGEIGERLFESFTEDTSTETSMTSSLNSMGEILEESVGIRTKDIDFQDSSEKINSFNETFLELSSSNKKTEIELKNFTFMTAETADFNESSEVTAVPLEYIRRKKKSGFFTVAINEEDETFETMTTTEPSIAATGKSILDDSIEEMSSETHMPFVQTFMNETVGAGQKVLTESTQTTDPHVAEEILLKFSGTAVAENVSTITVSARPLLITKDEKVDYFETMGNSYFTKNAEIPFPKIFAETATDMPISSTLHMISETEVEEEKTESAQTVNHHDFSKSETEPTETINMENLSDNVETTLSESTIQTQEAEPEVAYSGTYETVSLSSQKRRSYTLSEIPISLTSDSNNETESEKLRRMPLYYRNPTEVIAISSNASSKGIDSVTPKISHSLENVDIKIENFETGTSTPYIDYEENFKSNSEGHDSEMKYLDTRMDFVPSLTLETHSKISNVMTEYEIVSETATASTEYPLLETTSDAFTPSVPEITTEKLSHFASYLTYSHDTTEVLPLSKPITMEINSDILMTTLPELISETKNLNSKTVTVTDDNETNETETLLFIPTSAEFPSNAHNVTYEANIKEEKVSLANITEFYDSVQSTTMRSKFFTDEATEIYATRMPVPTSEAKTEQFEFSTAGKYEESSELTTLPLDAFSEDVLPTLLEIPTEINAKKLEVNAAKTADYDDFDQSVTTSSTVITAENFKNLVTNIKLPLVSESTETTSNIAMTTLLDVITGSSNENLKIMTNIDYHKSLKTIPFPSASEKTSSKKTMMPSLSIAASQVDAENIKAKTTQIIDYNSAEEAITANDEETFSEIPTTKITRLPESEIVKTTSNFLITNLPEEITKTIDESFETDYNKSAESMSPAFKSVLENASSNASEISFIKLYSGVEDEELEVGITQLIDEHGDLQHTKIPSTVFDTKPNYEFMEDNLLTLTTNTNSENFKERTGPDHTDANKTVQFDTEFSFEETPSVIPITQMGITDSEVKQEKTEILFVETAKDSDVLPVSTEENIVSEIPGTDLPKISILHDMETFEDTNTLDETDYGNKSETLTIPFETASKEVTENSDSLSTLVTETAEEQLKTKNNYDSLETVTVSFEIISEESPSVIFTDSTPSSNTKTIKKEMKLISSKATNNGVITDKLVFQKNYQETDTDYQTEIGVTTPTSNITQNIPVNMTEEDDITDITATTITSAILSFPLEQLQETTTTTSEIPSYSSDSSAIHSKTQHPSKDEQTPKSLCSVMNGVYKERLCFYVCKTDGNRRTAFYGFKRDGEPCIYPDNKTGVCQYSGCYVEK